MNKRSVKTLSITMAVIGLSYAAYSQQLRGDVSKKAPIISGTTVLDGSVKVVDNKGTIKYLQTNNGLTLLTNTTSDVTTTTWQLGGVLTDSTYIDLNGKAFGFKNIVQNTATTERYDDVAATQATLNTRGYTLLIRDEASGRLLKMLASDFIQSGQQQFTATSGQTDFTLTGVTSPSFANIWVYRNGVKLIKTTDYSIAGNTLTLLPKPSSTSTDQWAVLADDVIEVYYSK